MMFYFFITNILLQKFAVRLVLWYRSYFFKNKQEGFKLTLPNTNVVLKPSLGDNTINIEYRDTFFNSITIPRTFSSYRDIRQIRD